MSGAICFGAILAVIGCWAVIAVKSPVLRGIYFSAVYAVLTNLLFVIAHVVINRIVKAYEAYRADQAAHVAQAAQATHDKHN